MKTKRIHGMVLSAAMCAACLFVLEGRSATASPTTETLPVSISPAPTPGKWQTIWINRVEEFIAENKSLDPSRKNIVFVGDSLTQGFKLPTFFPELPVLNRGIVSDGMCDFPSGRNVWRGITRRMEESIFGCNPSHLFLLIGTNDVGVVSIPLDYWLGACKFILGQTRQKFPGVKIILVTCPPSGEAYARNKTLNARILEWNALLRQLAADEHYRLIDLHALLAGKDGLLPVELTRDGLHFNQLGYQRWAEAVRAILREDGVIH